MFLLAATASLLAACGEAAPTAGPTPTVSPEPTPATPPVETEPVPTPRLTLAWASCSIDLGGGYPSIEAECATADLPAQRTAPELGTTPIAVYRIGAGAPATAQLWMLNGGPGGAGFSLAAYAAMAKGRLGQAIDFYLVDHRGTGESTYFQCDRAFRQARTGDEMMRLCSAQLREQHGDAVVDGASTTESAEDVRDLMGAVAAPDQKVFLYGGSYGSYWAHRLLQLPDTRIDAVVTDGNCISSTCSFDVPQSLMVDEGAKSILDVCAATPDCRQRLGADPWAKAQTILTKLAGGHCANAAFAKYAPADLASGLGIVWPASLPVVLHRLDRCSAADVTFLNAFETKVRAASRAFRAGAGGSEGGGLPALPRPIGETPSPSADEEFSTALQLHVIGSELISRPAPSTRSLLAKADRVVFKPDPASLDISYFDAWDGYPRDAYVDGWLDRDVPWLMLQGTFDFQTAASLSATALTKLADPSLQRVEVVGAGHGVAFASTCALSMMSAFFANPRAKVDASCVADVTRTSLELDRRYVGYFFDGADAWGD